MTLSECDFTFLCQKRWDELRPTFSPDVRRCDQCSRDVFRVRTRAQVDEARALGRCVAWVRPERSRRGGADHLVGDIAA